MAVRSVLQLVSDTRMVVSVLLVFDCGPHVDMRATIEQTSVGGG